MSNIFVCKHIRKHIRLCVRAALQCYNAQAEKCCLTLIIRWLITVLKATANWFYVWRIRRFDFNVIDFFYLKKKLFRCFIFLKGH